MQAKMAQIIAIKYMQEKLNNLSDELMLSGDDGLSMDSLAYHKSWYEELDDFRDWLENEFAFKQYAKEAHQPFAIVQSLLGIR